VTDRQTDVQPIAITCVSLLAHVNKNLAIANRSRVSCINTNRSHNLATSVESRWFVVAFNRVAVGGIWLRQKSLRHILASPGYALGTIAVNVTWMEREFNACQTHCTMYPSIFNRFPVIQPVTSNVRHFSTFFAHFVLPWVRPWDNRGKCYMDGKRIRYLSNASAACTHQILGMVDESRSLMESLTKR